MSDTENQICPICSRQVQGNPRYPRYLCMNCANRAVAPDGRGLEFFNIGLSGGYAARYADTGADYPSHDCQVDGILCYADEARFGGIVIQTTR